MNAFRILVADGHPIVRLGLCSVLGSHIGWKVCGEAADGRDAVQKCLQLKPDLVILDICLPKLNGVDAARQILKDDPAQRILILTAVDSERVVRDCLQAGVQGWVLKSDGTGALKIAVEALQRHNCTFSPRVSDLLVDDQLKGSSGGPTAKVSQLTPREREVLQLLAEGKRCKEVAVVLNIAVKTADTHRSNMMFKLKIHSIAQLVLYAVRNEIIYVRSQAAALPERGSGLSNVTLQSLN
jgi:DNA-binding NarL/FixJ family response regulator